VIAFPDRRPWLGCAAPRGRDRPRDRRARRRARRQPGGHVTRARLPRV